MTTTSVFKIRAADGTFSKGGSSPTFSKAGKLWKRRGDVSSHFAQLDSRGQHTYSQKKCVVVELVTTEVAVTDVSAWVDAARERACARHDEQAAGWANLQRERDLAEFQRLAKVLGR